MIGTRKIKPRKPEPLTEQLDKVFEEPPYDVSVVIASHQTPAPILERAVTSAMQPRTQVIVVYDGDHPLFVPRHEDVHVLYQEKGGAASCWNLGAALAAGRYVMILGDDDFLEAGCLARLVQALDNSPVLAYAYGDVRIPGGVHVTPEWKKHEPGDRLRTGYAVLYPRHMHGPCQYYAPVDLPVYLSDYDFILQLEREGYTGLKVPGVVLNCVEKPRMGINIEAHRTAIEKHLWGRFS